MPEGFPKLYIVWKGELKPIDKPIFSTGDAYVLDNDKTIYIWLGIYCSVDEKGAAAIQSQKLDTDRAGAAKVVTVDQGSETPDFLAAVNALGGAMRLVEKNLVESMLKDVDTGSYSGHMAHVDALYRVSSEEFDGDLNAMKFLHVPFEKGSLDGEDVFIADLGDEILVWVGDKSNAKEKVMAGKWARQFDMERAGAQKITYYNEGEDTGFMDKCWGQGIVKSSSKMTQLSVEHEGAKDEGVQLFDETEAATPKPSPAPQVAPINVAAAFEIEKPSTPLTPTPKSAHAPSGLRAEEPIKSTPSTMSGEAPSTPTLIAESGARWVCPHCGNNDRRMIRELVDKTVLLNAYPPIYGKKLNCGKCGKDWRHK
ncbi:MAG: hypothetical protein RBG13Loki_3985 [Promethearchaeota archaeon CR_4]|nr:MAG: hypothetical protein RBG13Loki_3985 [Candidatus Lokiarchaeota archaeon CR_4]